MSIYRVATSNTYDRALLNIQQRQSQMGVSQEQLSSGKRVMRASDDAVAATLSERTQNRLARTEADLRSLEASRRSMAQAESTLGTVTELYARMKELVVQAGSGVLSDSDRVSTAQELSGIREQLIGLANQRDTAGRPMFSGLGVNNANGKAFVEATGPVVAMTYGNDGRTVTYDAQRGQVAATETSLPGALDGYGVFAGQMPNADPLQPDDDNVFETLDRAIYSLEGGATGPALTAELDIVNTQMARRLDQLMAARGKLGDWLNRADDMKTVFEDRSVAYQKENSELVDVDMVKAISDFQGNQTAYQAALQSYAQVQKMSMFDYLR